MEAVKRHGGRRIALGHGEHFRVHLGEPPNANRDSVLTKEEPAAILADQLLHPEAFVQFS
jgi:hypothetical protein